MKSQGETRLFLEKTISEIKVLRQLVDRKRNTLKIRCADTTLRMLLMKAEGALSYLLGGGDIAPLKIQEEIFRPVVDYWANVLGMDEEDI